MHSRDTPLQRHADHSAGHLTFHSHRSPRYPTQSLPSTRPVQEVCPSTGMSSTCCTVIRTQVPAHTATPEAESASCFRYGVFSNELSKRTALRLEALCSRRVWGFVVFFSNLRASRVDCARRRRAEVAEAGRGARRARGPESEAFRSDYLGPRGVPRGGGAVRPCAQGHPKLVGTARREGRFRPPPACAGAEARRFARSTRSPGPGGATGCGHGRPGRARRPYGAPRGQTTPRDG